ncbi:hypothetical protein NKI72_24675 [Mesorhizobium sp. M0437]|uniref:hypothetical protein n=1 Tax=Mesorhizobium sp. M0437 TaxID=2956945 RepID=UPI003337FAC3
MKERWPRREAVAWRAVGLEGLAFVSLAERDFMHERSNGSGGKRLVVAKTIGDF